MKRKLEMAAAFFQNDKPTGIGISIFARNGEDLQRSPE